MISMMGWPVAHDKLSMLGAFKKHPWFAQTKLEASRLRECKDPEK
jgi:hypothetical protein